MSAWLSPSARRTAVVSCLIRREVPRAASRQAASSTVTPAASPAWSMQRKRKAQPACSRSFIQPGSVRQQHSATRRTSSPSRSAVSPVWSRSRPFQTLPDPPRSNSRRRSRFAMRTSVRAVVYPCPRLQAMPSAEAAASPSAGASSGALVSDAARSMSRRLHPTKSRPHPVRSVPRKRIVAILPRNPEAACRRRCSGAVGQRFMCGVSAGRMTRMLQNACRTGKRRGGTRSGFRPVPTARMPGRMRRTGQGSGVIVTLSTLFLWP